MLTNKQNNPHVHHPGEVSELVSKKTSSQLFKRDLVLADETGTEVTLTLWGEQATADGAKWEGQPILAVKKVYSRDDDDDSCLLFWSLCSLFLKFISPFHYYKNR